MSAKTGNVVEMSARYFGKVFRKQFWSWLRGMLYWVKIQALDLWLRAARSATEAERRERERKKQLYHNLKNDNCNSVYVT